MKKILLVAVIVCLTLGLMACGEKKDVNTDTLEEATTEEVTAEESNIVIEPGREEENTEQENKGGSLLAVKSGAYERDGNYIVIDEQGNITCNGIACEITGEKPEDEYGYSYVYFTCEGTSSSVMVDKVDNEKIYSDYGVTDHSQYSFSPINVAQVPQFDVKDEQVADATSETSTASQTEKYPFVGVTYKHESVDATFQLRTPDADGNPTEVVINGEIYDGKTFNNEIFTLSEVKITETSDSYYIIDAFFPYGDKKHAFLIGVNEDGSWDMKYPCEGIYYPE